MPLGSDYTPPPEQVARLEAARLHVGRVVEDFVSHWQAKGARKAPRNWNLTFVQNVTRILATDWLRERFAMTASETARAKWPPLEQPPPSSVSDEEAQRRLDEALRELDASTSIDGIDRASAVRVVAGGES